MRVQSWPCYWVTLGQCIASLVPGSLPVGQWGGMVQGKAMEQLCGALPARIPGS